MKESLAQAADGEDKDIELIKFKLTFAKIAKTGCLSLIRLAGGKLEQITSEKTMLCSASTMQIYKFITAVVRQSKLVSIDRV